MRAVLIAVLCIANSLAQSHSGFPVDIRAGVSPSPVKANGEIHLVYELHLTNFASLPIQVTRIEVFGDNATSPIAVFDGKQLGDMVVAVEKLSAADSPSESKGNPAVGEGHAAVVFLDLVVAQTPKHLWHRFSLSVARKNKPDYLATVDSADLQTLPMGMALHPPVRGSGWVAFNALGAEDHRRSYNAFDGRERIPQRFAIDWMRLGPDGKLFHGDKSANGNFYGYGAQVLAVADARVAELKDGIPDNSGTTERSARAITLDNVFGNYIMLDLGDGRFAVYAHLQPGSISIKVGDRVKAGDVLGLLGNSGNSDEPHLHFHLINGGSPMGAEGIPYEFETFTQLGIAPDDSAPVLLEKAQEKPTPRKREFPLNNAVVSFP